jgi:hypothetical protein
VDFPRPLTEMEKAVALRALELGGVSEIDALRKQLDAAIATEACSCGCPTVSLAVDPHLAPQAEQSGRPIAEAYYDCGAVMVWVDDGYLSNLEIWWWSDERPAAWPALDALSDVAPPD